MKSRRWLKWLRLTILLVLLIASLSAVVVAAAPQVSILGQEDGEDPDDEGGKIGGFCLSENYTLPTIEGFKHPVAARLSDGDAADYLKVMAWFCEDGMGFGQIKLALATAARLDGDEATPDADALLLQRQDGLGWGQIWREAGLIGRGRWQDSSQTDGDGISDDDAPDAQGPPEHAAPPAWGRLKDKDSLSGRPPAQAGEIDDGGPPDHARSRHNRP